MTDSPTPRLDVIVSMPFEARLRQCGQWPVTAVRPTVLQMNLGYRCNQQCRHCHHNSGPMRTETMPDEVMEACIAFALEAGISEFDLTGGAPELHPRFGGLVTRLRGMGAEVTDRCNLTVLTEPGNEELGSLLAAHGVHVVASLPCYTEENTDLVRGQGVFAKTIAGLKMLNAAGYGESGTGLRLTLAYSPSGASLPGRQESLEVDYRKRLAEDYGFGFTRLITMANMPIGRFLRLLESDGNLGTYMRELERSLNPATLPGLMCRTTLSVGWDGTLYDCDFNQALGIAIGNGRAYRVGNVLVDELVGRGIRCGNHCYGCTAGNGSSCGGEPSRGYC